MFCGIYGADAFLMFAAFLSFYNVSKVYKENNGLRPCLILQLYLKRYLRYAPVVFVTLLFGMYVMPQFHGGWNNLEHHPVWFSFYDVLFYECDKPATMISKILFYSNLYPYYQDDKYGCMNWTWTFECEIQLFLFMPFIVIAFHKWPKFATFMIFCLMIFGIFLVKGIVEYYQLQVGIFTLNNGAFMFAFFLQKPWMKIHMWTMGILSAMMY